MTHKSRPAPTLAPIPSFLAAVPGGTQIRIKVQPRASRDEVVDVSTSELKVRVTAPPVDSAANEAVLNLLADRLSVRRGDVHLVRGGASRHKLVFVQGLDAASVSARLLVP